MPVRASRPLLALVCAMSLSACSSEEAPPAPPPPYDGPWEVLPELGEWVDPGAFAACPAPSSQVACHAPETITLSDCDPGSLVWLERHGAIYNAEVRYEIPAPVGGAPSSTPHHGGFRFDARGQPEFVMEGRASSTSVVGERLVLSNLDHYPEAIRDRYTFVGCRAQGTRSLTGCFYKCRGNRLTVRGSFRAERMTSREGEPEFANLQLLSESFVNPGKPVDVYVTRGHAYVVSINRSFSNTPSGGLTVFDVSNPRAPVQTASIQFPNNGYWNGVWAKDNALYVASGDSGVLMFDLENPAQPAFVRNHPGGSRIDVHTVFVEGNRLYAMSPSPNKETLIFDVTRPLEPQLLTRYVYPGGTGYPHDAFAYEGRLYINHLDDGFLIAELNDETPKLLGRYTYPHTFSHANAVGTFNGRTVAFEGGEALGSHVRVLDVTNPANIVKIGEYKLRSLTSVHNMLLVGTRLYLAYYHEGVRVLDVSNPSQPREIAHYNTFRESDPNRRGGLTEGAIGIRVPGDGRIYVVDTSRGLLIFNDP
ncbi:LVIVD repeat-containing protein [Myxococcus sp. 1LA]